MKKVAIIGAGLAGLTVAYTLQKEGHQVYLFERSSEIGGVMRSNRHGEYLVEAGPHTILESCVQIRSFLDELGLERLYPDNCAKIRYIVRGGRLLPLPMSPPALIKSKLFSARGKWRLLREPFIARETSGKEETIAEFVCRRMGQEFLDYAINPFVAGTYAGKPDKLSVVHAFAKMHRIEEDYGSLIRGQIKMSKKRKVRSQILSFKNGLQELPQAMAQKIGSDNIYLNEEVKNIDFSEEIMVSSGARKVSVSDVVYAGTIYGLDKITLNGDKLKHLSSLKTIYYPPIAVLCLGFHRDDVAHNLDGFGFLVPEKEKSKILGALFCSSLFPHRAPKDHVLLTVFIGGARQPQLALLDQGEIVKIAKEELRKYLGIKGKTSFCYMTQWERSIPQYEIGYGEHKKTFASIEKDFPHFYLAGNYRQGVSITDTIKYSLSLAQKLIADDRPNLPVNSS